MDFTVTGDKNLKGLFNGTTLVTTQNNFCMKPFSRGDIISSL